MAMHNNGLSKLTEECGEVLQVVGKINAYPSGVHPDGGDNLYLRLEKELADLEAATAFVIEKLKLNRTALLTRAAVKLTLFENWDGES